MKLSEILPDMFKLANKNLNMDDYYNITPEMLKIPMIKEKLLQCEEFSGIEELIILDR